jgi:shikimate kinase
MKQTKNIFLIGPRGCGKTSVGIALARRLGCGFSDTDHALVEAVGMEIAEYVAEQGWEAFRDRETQTLGRVAAAGADEGGWVIGCGGGIVLRPRNREILATGITLYLRTSVQTLADRLAKDLNEAQRPSLTGRPVVEEVRDVLAERAELYEGCADAILPEADLDELVELAVTQVRRLS